MYMRVSIHGRFKDPLNQLVFTRLIINFMYILFPRLVNAKCLTKETTSWKWRSTQIDLTS